MCSTSNQVLKDVSQMSREELAETEAQLSRAEEIAACLINTDGSSQLRPNKVSSAF